MPRRKKASTSTKRGENHVSKMFFKSPSAKGEAALAGDVLKMMLDPCSAPPVSVPDAHSGKVALIRSVSRQAFILDASGNRGIIVFPNSKSKIAFSGAAAYGTWVFFDDSLQAEVGGSDYSFIRQIASCVTLTPRQGDDTAKGGIIAWCGPSLSTSDRTSSGTGLNDKELHILPVDAPSEVGWCPRQIADFVPFVGSTAPGAASACINSQLMSYIPSVHLDISGGTASAPYELAVTSVYECFYSQSQQFRPGMPSPTNFAAMSLIINAVRNLSWVRDSDMIHKAASYAEKVKRFIERPEVQAAWSVGKTLALAM